MALNKKALAEAGKIEHFSPDMPKQEIALKLLLDDGDRLSSIKERLKQWDSLSLEEMRKLFSDLAGTYQVIASAIGQVGGAYSIKAERELDRETYAKSMSKLEAVTIGVAYNSIFMMVDHMRDNSSSLEEITGSIGDAIYQYGDQMVESYFSQTRNGNKSSGEEGELF